MHKVIVITGVLVALSMAYNSYNNSSHQQTKQGNNMEPMKTNAALPRPDKWVTSPVRNKITLELNAPIAEVWALVGDPAKMPAYSPGLQKVDTRLDALGKCSEYTCHFKPAEQGGQVIIHTAKMLWYEPMKGWASRDEEPNAFGLQQSLTLVTMEEKEHKTILHWAMHFDCENEELLQMNVSALEQALNKDIAAHLTATFGGKVVENFMQEK